MTRASMRWGLLALLVYAAAAVGTAEWGPGRLRPLFDGFGSHPGVYNWVKPPKEFAEGNRPPEAGQARVAFGDSGSSAATADTADGQATAQAPAGAIPRQGSDGAATIDLRPLDPSTLGPLPDGLRAEGNAYQVSVTYLPSKAQAARLTQPGTVGVLSEVASDTLLFAPDGQAWRAVEGRPVAGGKGFTAPLTELGYYMAAGKGAPRPFEASGGPPVALFLVGALVPLGLGALLLSRRRGTGPGRSSGPARRPPQRGAKPAARKAKAGPSPTGRAGQGGAGKGGAGKGGAGKGQPPKGGRGATGKAGTAGKAGTTGRGKGGKAKGR